MMDTGLGKGIEEYGNMGDISMLQVAVARLQRLFPETNIDVLTDSAENLARFCPGARPLDNRGRAIWFANAVSLGKYFEVAPGWLISLLVRVRKTARSHCPKLLRASLIWKLNRRNRSAEAGAVAAFLS